MGNMRRSLISVGNGSLFKLPLCSVARLLARSTTHICQFFQHLWVRICERATSGHSKPKQDCEWARRDPKHRLAYQALVFATFAPGKTCGTTSCKKKCGGTIVNKRYIITAAHCLHIDSEFHTKVDVMIGELNYCDGANEGGSWIPVK